MYYIFETSLYYIDRRNIMLLVRREPSYIYQLCIFKRFVSFDLTRVSLFPTTLY